MTTRKLQGPLGGDYQTDGNGNAVLLNTYPLTEEDDVPLRLADHEARVTAAEGVLAARTYDPVAASVLVSATTIQYIGWRALAIDPNYPTRLWGGTGNGFSYRSLTGGYLSAGVKDSPATGSDYLARLLFSASHMFAVVTRNASRVGAIWRSPLPNEAADNIAWEKLFDLNGGILISGTPTSGGENAYFREGSVVLDAADNLYAIEYGSAVTGGPSLYKGANASTAEAATFAWTKLKTWSNAKHGHALLIDATTSTIWATLGDSGFDEIGLWRATLAAPGTWSRMSAPASYAGGGNDLYGINMRIFERDGVRMMLMEDDSRLPYGLLLHQSINAQQSPDISVAPLPAPYFGTARGLHICDNGHIYFVTTGENGIQGQYDCYWVWRFGDPSPIRLQTVATPSAGTVLTTVETADHVFFGTNRLTKAQFRDEQ